MARPRIIIGISGASGAIYGVRLLEALRLLEVETHLIVSRAGSLTLAHEMDLSLRDVRALADFTHGASDVGASVSSGSFRTLGMIVAPCSMKTLGEIAHGIAGNLLARAADVVLKERRRLVLMTRETPLTLAHLKNMQAVTEMGGVIAPPVPAFYARPASLDAMVGHTVARVLDLFGLDTGSIERWAGIKAAAPVELV